MFLLTLTTHSLLRWLALAFGLIAVVRALVGVLTRQPWTPSDDRAGRLFVIAFDVQALVGLVLYFFLSPITQHALSNMGSAMTDPVTRYWAVEHIALMILALGMVHLGRARSRRATTDAAKHRSAAIFYTLGFVAMVAATPWPFMPAGRPLLPTL